MKKIKASTSNATEMKTANFGADVQGATVKYLANKLFDDIDDIIGGKLHAKRYKESGQKLGNLTGI
jgi:hypothetical protein